MTLGGSLTVFNQKTSVSSFNINKKSFMVDTERMHEENG